MKQLTINELAPYLPYGLKIQFTQLDDGISGIGELYRIETGKTDKQLFEINPTIIVSDYELYLLEDEIKPILRPLSDLTEEIEHNGERFVPYKVLGWEYLHDNTEFGQVVYCEYGESPKTAINVIDYIGDYHTLLSWHFDVFGLLDKGLAIDINSLTH